MTLEFLVLKLPPLLARIYHVRDHRGDISGGALVPLVGQMHSVRHYKGVDEVFLR